MAGANGRFPKAQALVTRPGSDGRELYMRATFGVMRSTDGGASWRWMCEPSLGYDGTWDPAIAVTRDGVLWVGLPDGLAYTRDGCDVTRVPELAGETVKDLTTDPAGQRVWAITSAEGRRSFVWSGTPVKGDAGGAPLRWERQGAGLEDMHLMTVEVAPSRPARVYVTGQPFGTVRGRLLASDDGGRTWTGGVNTLADDGPLFIAAIDPKRPDRVFVRHLHLAGSDLLVTPDRGKTLSHVLRIKSSMLGFAKSADGATYWAGSGLPEDGVYRSDDRGEHFAPVGHTGVLCLHADGPRLFNCANPFTLGGYALGLSEDRGVTFKPVSGFADIAGPVACAGPDGGTCARTWPETRAFIVPDAGAPSASTPSASSSATPSDAGPPAPSAPSSRCGCWVVGGPNRGVDLGVLIGGLSLAALRARRRTRGRRDPAASARRCE